MLDPSKKSFARLLLAIEQELKQKYLFSNSRYRSRMVLEAIALSDPECKSFEMLCEPAQVCLKIKRCEVSMKDGKIKNIHHFADEFAFEDLKDESKKEHGHQSKLNPVSTSQFAQMKQQIADLNIRIDKIEKLLESKF